MSNAETRSTGSLDRSQAARGLNIQFTKSSPTIPPPRTENEVPRDPHLHKQAVTARSWSAPTSPTMSNIVDDLMQVQRELALLARTENMHLSTNDLLSVSLKPTIERRGDESPESDGDTTLYDDETHGALDRKRFFGSEYDLRNAVVERLAELREKRLSERLTVETSDIATALRDTLKHLGILLKLVATKHPLALAALGLLLALVADTYARSSTTTTLTLSPPTNSSN